MAIFQKSRTKAIQKTLAGLGWEYRHNRRPFVLAGAMVITGMIAGWIYIRRRGHQKREAEETSWLDLAELEMSAYQQEPMRSQKLAAGS